MFGQYRVGIIDASFYRCSFTEEVKDALRNISIWVPESFDEEVKQYKAILSDEQREAYEANTVFLNGIKPNKGSIREVDSELNTDMFGLINYCIKNGKGKKIVVITANEMLISRLILDDYHIDIYNLYTNSFIHLGEGNNNVRAEYEYKETSPKPIKKSEKPADKNTKLYMKNGKTIVLGDALHTDGLEGRLYKVNNKPGMIAKIYNEGVLDGAKFLNLCNIEGMNNRLGINWAIFPSDMIYYDAKCEVPAGVTETYVETIQNLKDFELYGGNIADIPANYLNIGILYTIQLAIHIVKQVCYLNSYGFFVSDFNLANFALNKHSEFVQMWDTDSFGYKDYYSGMTNGARTYGTYDITKKADTIKYCTEMLFSAIFKLFSLGDDPISEFNGKFKYDKEKYAQKYRKSFFTDNLWEYFEAVYRGKREFSAEELLAVLSREYDRINRDKSTNLTYRELLKDFISIDESGIENNKEKTENKSLDEYLHEVEQNQINKPNNTEPSELSTGKKRIKVLPLLIILIWIFTSIYVILNGLFDINSWFMTGKVESVVEIICASKRFDRDIGLLFWELLKKAYY